jgi:hypothetical protein
MIDLSTMLMLAAFRFQLEMIVEELQRHAPGQGEAIPHSERMLWSRAIGALRSASTHLQNLTEAPDPSATIESAAKRVRRGKSLAELRRWREEKAGRAPAFTILNGSTIMSQQATSDRKDNPNEQ